MMTTPHITGLVHNLMSLEGVYEGSRFVWSGHYWLMGRLGCCSPDELFNARLLQSIYYSLRLFLLNLREAYQRTAAEYHRAKAAAEETLTKARAEAGELGEEGEGVTKGVPSCLVKGKQRATGHGQH